MLETIMFCVWLLPTGNFNTYLQNQIDELAATYQAPTFVPHVTVFCGETKDIERVKSFLQQSAEELPAITLNYQSIGATEHYFKTVI